MKNYKNYLFCCVLAIIIFCPSMVKAHSPRIVEAKFTEVQNPQSSQAYYGQLNGEPDFFRIKSDKTFKLYVAILVPDINGVKKDISADIMKNIDAKENKSFVVLLDGTKFTWTKFYEPFAGDNYWQGPEVRAEAAAGIYTIRVFSLDNYGKYVLAVGEKEKFGFGEMVETIRMLPKLKTDFFNKSALTAYFNYIGIFMLAFLLSIVALVLFLVWIYKKIRRGGSAIRPGGENL